MRILISGETYYPGNNGQAIFTIHLAEGLVRAGNEVAVIVPATGFEYRKEEINGVHVHRLHTISLDWMHPEVFLSPLPGLKIRSILEEFQPDVVHVQDHYFLNWDGVRIARRMGIPVMGTNHFLPENHLPYVSWLPLPRKFKVYVMWQLMLWTYNQVDMVTTPTETAARILSKQRINPPIYPVSCGVDTNWFKPADADRSGSTTGFDRGAVLRKWGLDPEAVTFLYVGRLDREKRIDMLLHALNRLRQNSEFTKGKNKVQLAIAGHGSASAELRALACALQIEGQAVFLGYVPAPDLPDLYRAGDVFCMPSPEELQSIATLESMASCKPVIAANARALPELVTPEVNGLLFEPGNYEALAASMQWMLEHRERWKDMGHASRSRAIGHSLENTIRRYEELYLRIRNPHPRHLSHGRERGEESLNKGRGVSFQ